MKEKREKLKRVIAVVLLALLAVSLCACESPQRVINVYNWGEYLPDGSEGSIDVNALFTEKTGIKVNYINYQTNEEMYAKLSGGGVSYDVIIPSDYMIERMIKEGMLQKLDFENIPNYKYIIDQYKNLPYDENNEYSVPYTVGYVGLIYNTKVVTEKPTSWSVLWDEKYAGNILMIDNSRDAFAVAQFLLGQDVNTTDEEELRAAADKLKEQKPLVQKYVMDEIFNKMESGEAALGVYYAGDFLTMHDNNEDLAFVYPEEGTNFFVDAMCIPTCANDKEAAEMYIDFLLSPEIALEIAEYICYATPNSSVLENEEYSLKDNEFLYPDQDAMDNAQIFSYLPPETTDYVNTLWNEISVSGIEYGYFYIAFGIAAVVIVTVIIIVAVRKKKRSNYEED